MLNFKSLTFRGTYNSTSDAPVNCTLGDVICIRSKALIDNLMLVYNGNEWEPISKDELTSASKEKSTRFYCKYCGTHYFEKPNKSTPHCPNCGALMVETIYV